MGDSGASVVAIYTAPSAGAPMVPREAAVLVAGVGIEGDRYALRTGTWSAPRWHDQQLTLFAAEVAEAISVEPSLVRRNLVTRGVDLLDLVGLRFRIGAVELAGMRVCAPCRYIQQLNGLPGLTKALGGANGGLRARIVTGGTIRPGDPLEVVGLDAPLLDAPADARG